MSLFRIVLTEHGWYEAINEGESREGAPMPPASFMQPLSDDSVAAALEAWDKNQIFGRATAMRAALEAGLRGMIKG
jgi:hypothetical protein